MEKEIIGLISAVAVAIISNVFINRKQFTNFKEEILGFVSSKNGHQKPLDICISEHDRMKQDLKKNENDIDRMASKIFSTINSQTLNIALIQKDIEIIKIRYGLPYLDPDVLVKIMEQKEKKP